MNGRGTLIKAAKDRKKFKNANVFDVRDGRG